MGSLPHRAALGNYRSGRVVLLPSLPHRAALGQLARSYGPERLARVVLRFELGTLLHHGVVDELAEPAGSLRNLRVQDRAAHTRGVVRVLVEAHLLPGPPLRSPPTFSH